MAGAMQRGLTAGMFATATVNNSPDTATLSQQQGGCQLIQSAPRNNDILNTPVTSELEHHMRLSQSSEGGSIGDEKQLHTAWLSGSNADQGLQESKSIPASCENKFCR